jgi:hypothetical protein
MANKVIAPLPVADCGYDVEGVLDQTFNPITGMVGWVGPGTSSISPLVRRHREVARLRHRIDLCIPEEPRHAKAMQHQHQRTTVVAPDRHIEHHAACRLYVSRLDHPNLRVREVGRHHLPEGGQGSCMIVGSGLRPPCKRAALDRFANSVASL